MPELPKLMPPNGLAGAGAGALYSVEAVAKLANGFAMFVGAGACG